MVYHILFLYWDNFFSQFCTTVILERLWRLPFDDKICSQYNLENFFFDLDKTWR